ncbi:ATP-dependent Clp protease ATP-binding subunit [Deinococcus wulumuqiensis]|uniref:Clp protease ATP-binding protein n=1 Tax=Deinococcus wulumuqiensis TaxID=980427 RepID=A0AAV4K3H9_9DEIO|nr:ATP-dependent Clp protease ATP-binding subunit [Deinococcus wulumuqiensis]QII20432.1 ATP-dependent Clp protease ATP-binding subunit [Deinococcus wulumuqiensis R12]GGI77485.1 Clp protease ATP-binding protein [Deinococcus wulumuqiensis]GGP28839.1 Clp protease ATP-binding protein [Deinococcus wulumuqiensis]
MTNRFDDRARLVFHYAREEGNRLGHAMVGPEHLLLGLMREGGGAAQILGEFGATLDSLRRKVEDIIGRGEGSRLNDAPSITPRARRVMELSGAEARALGSQTTSTQHILLGIIREGDGVAFRILQDLTKDVETIRWRILAEDSGGEGKGSKPVPTPFLDEYGRDLTKWAREGKLDPVIGRSEEIRRVTQILTRRTKNNPVLIGDPGVGKTAIVEGLALAIHEQRTPPSLHGVRLISLDLSGVVAGTKYRGEFEERLRQIIEELRTAKVMAFIDELHTLVGAGGAEGTLDAANILKPALSRGEIQVIGATTTGEYHRYIEKDAALERRFQPVIVLEPSPAETLQILRGLKPRYEEHHGVQIPDSALELAVRIGERSLPGRNFPDKAIDLIDEAASRVRLNMSVGLPVGETESGEPMVTREDMESVINSMGGIYSEETGAALVDLEEQLGEQVYGQAEAVRALTSAMRRARVGLGGRARVSASFLFVGPSGVGKTHLAKALARTLFGSERALIRVDMSEFQEGHSISKLIGSPPGYVGFEQGGRLTEAVRRQPFSVILLDEIEKAHPDIYNTFLQVLDDGRLTDGQGRTVDFRRTVIIMTSNTGFNVNPTVGFSPVTPDSNAPLRNIFTPEFLDRLDDVIRFKSLGEEELVRVAQQLLGEMREELASRELNVTFDPAIAAWVVGKLRARSPKHAVGSSRQLRTLLREELEDPLALYLVEQGARDLRVVLGEDSIEFEQTERSAPPQILA